MPKRVATGRVTSAAASKTRRVEVPRIVRHKKYGRILHRRTVCHVHDEEEESAPTGTLTPEVEAMLKKVPEQWRAEAEKRFKAMTPEQQREALKRMKEMGGQGGAGRGGPSGGERQPPRRERARD